MNRCAIGNKDNSCGMNTTFHANKAGTAVSVIHTFPNLYQTKTVFLGIFNSSTSRPSFEIYSALK